MRRLGFFLIALFAALTLTARANGAFEVRGQLSANDTEMQEGYFAIAEDTVLMVRPDSPLHNWLKQHSGQTVRIVLEPVPTQ